MNTLEFDSLRLEFGLHRVLSDVYMSCSTGKITGLLGRNGSGKSCLMQMVFGIWGEDKSVRVNKAALIDNYLKRKLIAYLPQQNLVPSFLTFAQALNLYEVNPEKIVEAFPELKECLIQKPAEVSGGLRGLFEVMMMLNTTHPFCILDEPFSGIMPVHIEKLKVLLNLEKSKKGFLITFTGIFAILLMIFMYSPMEKHIRLPARSNWWNLDI